MTGLKLENKEVEGEGKNQSLVMSSPTSSEAALLSHGHHRGVRVCLYTFILSAMGMAVLLLQLCPSVSRLQRQLVNIVSTPFAPFLLLFVGLASNFGDDDSRPGGGRFTESAALAAEK